MLAQFTINYSCYISATRHQQREGIEMQRTQEEERGGAVERETSFTTALPLKWLKLIQKEQILRIF